MSYIGCCNLLDANLCGETQGKHFAANFVVKRVGSKPLMFTLLVPVAKVFHFLPQSIF